jgi:preprotein translocase subunit SecG
VSPTPDLRPRTVGEILDASFQLYRKRFGTLLLACTILSVPSLAAAVLLSHGAGDAFGDYLGAAMRYFEAAGSSHRNSPAMRDALNKMLAQATEVQIYGLASTALQALSRGGACIAGAIVTFAAVRREPTPGAWATVKLSVGRLVPATGVHLFLAVVTGMCALCLPVPILAAAVLAPACAALVAETGPMETSVRSWSFGPARAVVAPFAAFVDVFGRSFSLSMHGMTIVRGTTAVSLVLLFVTTLVSAVSLAGGLVAKSFGVWFVLQHYAEVMFLPVIGIAFSLWYLDLRVRREGLDLTEAA